MSMNALLRPVFRSSAVMLLLAAASRDAGVVR